MAPFFVKKKDWNQRLVLDCRQTNRYHRDPPHSDLSTPSALGELGVDDCFAAQGGELFGASVDLVDSFYQFWWPLLASWFCFDDVVDLGGFEGARVFDEASCVFLDLPDSTLVVPAFEGLSRGWSWALYICHRVVSYELSIVVSEFE